MHILVYLAIELDTKGVSKDSMFCSVIEFVFKISVRCLSSALSKAGQLILSK